MIHDYLITYFTVYIIYIYISLSLSFVFVDSKLDFRVGLAGQPVHQEGKETEG